jgi:hypothetical protein
LADSNFAAINSTCQNTPAIGWSFIQIDKNTGDTIFTKSFSSICEDNVDMTYSKDSNLLICQREKILKMTPSGILLWTSILNISSCYCISSCNDNGMAAGGYDWSYDTPGEPGFYQSVVVKLDSLGKLY